MSKRTIISTIALSLVAMATVSCASKQYANKADEVVEPPDETADVEGIGTERWCSDFGQPGLDVMVERAWSDNVQLKAAWARLRQARAVADIADADRWPSVQAGAGAEVVSGQVIAGVPTNGSGEPEATWDLSATASYEVDVWGRFAHRAEAAELEADAAEASARALAISLTSEVAEAWFDVITHRQRVELLERQIEVSQNVLAITRQRLQRGLAQAIDVVQLEQNIESLRGRLATARGSLATSRHRLAVLIGKTPDDDKLVDGSELPDVEPLDQAGVPADLLERRPDVRAAYLRLEAADERTAAAVADRLPRLRLDASVGFRANALSNFFQQLFWSVGAGVTQPIFEGGRLRAQVERNEAVAQEQLYNYANTLLVAIREVRDALALERTQYERIESLEQQMEKARSVLDLARTLYRSGTADYLRVLTGLTALQDVERTLLEARRQQISHRIELCRALGGSWVDAVEPSIEEDDE